MVCRQPPPNPEHLAYDTNSQSRILRQELNIVPDTDLDNRHRTLFRTEWYCYRVYSSVLFVFSKQPYDAGDRVIIEEKERIVEKVCLLYTVFHRCSDCAVEQIAHKKICDLWINNLTRSKGIFIKEVASIPDKSDMLTSTQLEAHEKGLVAFINEETVRRRYLDVGDVKVSL
jgi:hypothetical protein